MTRVWEMQYNSDCEELAMLLVSVPDDVDVVSYLDGYSDCFNFSAGETLGGWIERPDLQAFWVTRNFDDGINGIGKIVERRMQWEFASKPEYVRKTLQEAVKHAENHQYFRLCAFIIEGYRA